MFEIFRRCSGIVVAVSKKEDGTMKLVGDSVRDKDIIKNRERFLERLEIDEKLTIKADLVHGNNVEVVFVKEAGTTIKEIDGLITSDRNLFLTITVADCLPIFIYDPEKEIVGLIHGGWRSLAGNILASAIGMMIKNFGSLTKDILIGIGPGISQCHFEVKKDVLARFKSFLSEASIHRDGKTFLNLKRIAKVQLINLGLKGENIEISPECTFCLSEKYFSFRKDKPKIAETMIAVIGLKTSGSRGRINKQSKQSLTT